MNILALNQVPPQAWRNGGGSTRELLAWPHAGDWQLRVSVATIEHSGAFSRFDGVQRWFAVIDGKGVSLALPGGTLVQTSADEALCFDGEAAPLCHLLDGATTDLNLMVQRGSGVGQMQLAHPGEDFGGHWRWRGIYVATDAVINIDDVALPLYAGSLLWSDDAKPQAWQLQQAGAAWWLGLRSP